MNIDYDNIKVVTDKAILFEICGEEVWIPISQIKDELFDEDDVDSGEGTINIPKWLAYEKDLI